MRGTIFNIQKYSIHDGPGIRTTVFLKGCPLRCQWCSNPESQSFAIQILYDSKKCVGCQTCVHTCPHHALTYQEGIHFNQKACDGCLDCIKACPQEALSYEGEHQSVKKIIEICLQDKDFYEESGGGVTISGGEGMSQPDFLEAIVKGLKAEGIHTAIETTSFVDPKVFHDLAPLFDLLLLDLKHYDPIKHKEGTGVDNTPIIHNIQWAIERGLTHLVRIPVIPGFNASHEDAKGLAKLCQEIGIKKVQLLPFHQFGENKYDLLKRDYSFKNKKALHPEDLVEYRQIFIDQGIDCFF